MTSRNSSDITIYGATGFVAHYIIQYLLSVPPKSSSTPPLRITLAGRNKSKLQSVLTSHPTPNHVQMDLFVADCQDSEALATMTKRTSVVLNCAGPFSKYGTEVVRACAETGTDYVDITGEVDWASEMKERFHSTAVKTKARIIPFCGFDSIPSDVAIYAAVRALKWENETEMVSGTTWHANLGLLNGGTLHTALEMPLNVHNCFLDETSGRLRKVPYFISDPYSLATKQHPPSDKYNAATREWLNQLPSIDKHHNYAVSIPFFMAAVNAKVVHATSSTLDYGPNFTYGERYFPFSIDTSRKLSFFTLFPSLFFLWLLAVITCIFKLPILGKRLATYLLPPGTGSPTFIIERGYAQVYARVESSHGKTATAFLKFKGDPGNLVTAQCIAESALCLLWEKDTLDTTKFGFGTPCGVMGDALIKRLLENEVRGVELETNVMGGRKKVKGQ